MINEQHFTWGAFISALITFVLTAAVVYFVVVLPIKAIMERRKRGEEAGPAEPTQVELLVEIRDLLRAQQGGPGQGSVPSERGVGWDGALSLVAAPVRRAVLQVAAVVVRRRRRAARPSRRRCRRAPVPGRPGPAAPAGSVGGQRLAEALEHLGRRQRGEQRPGHGELAAAGARSRSRRSPRPPPPGRRAPASRRAGPPA